MRGYMWIGLIAVSLPVVSLGNDRAEVTLWRTPHQGLQPQAVVDDHGTVHLVYFRGEPAAGDLYYTRRAPDGGAWSEPIRVNSHPRSAIAVGSIRGAQMALGRNNRLHVVWNGSAASQTAHAGKTPLLYTRMKASGGGFEPERNVITTAWGLDGGSSVAADAQGRVYVVWHAPLPGKEGEAHRRVFVARSTDGGQTFAPERAVSSPLTGVCPCCGLKALVDHDGRVFILYRTAPATSHRDMTLLVSDAEGRDFRVVATHPWSVFTCPMSSASLVESALGIVAAWETQEQVYWARADASGLLQRPVSPTGWGRRKHPALAVNSRGDVLLAWTEGTAWAKGGALEWQVFDGTGAPLSKKQRVGGVPAWSFPAACALPDDRFVIVY